MRPPSESQEPHALDRVGMRDPSPVPSFDRVARLAVRMIDATAARVSLLDGARVLLKGHACRDRPDPPRELPAAHSLAPLVVRRSERVVLEGRDLVAGPGGREGAEYRAAVGLPLFTREGEAVGALVVLDRRERTWTDADLWFLEELAASVSAEIVLRQEIAERDQVSDTCREGDHRYRLIVEGSRQVFFYTHDSEGRFTYLSPSVAEVLGYSADELVGRPYASLLTGHPTDRAVHERTAAGLESGVSPAPYVATVRHRDGRRLVLEIVESPVRRGGVGAIHGFARDVTQRVEAEEALRESEERFRQLAEHVREVFWIYDPAAAELAYLSPLYDEVWGRSREAALADPDRCTEAIHPEDRLRATHAMRRDLVAGMDQTFRIVRPDGSQRWIRARSFPVPAEDGEIRRVVGVMEDVTEWRSLVRRLRDSEAGAATGGPPTRAVVELAADVPEIGGRKGDLLVLNDSSPDEFGLYRTALRAELPRAIQEELARLTGSPASGSPEGPTGAPGSPPGRGPHLWLVP